MEIHDFSVMDGFVAMLRGISLPDVARSAIIRALAFRRAKFISRHKECRRERERERKEEKGKEKE